MSTSMLGGAQPDARAEQSGVLTVYDDLLSPEFINYGWAEMDLEESTIVHGGSRSVRLNPDHDKALYFYKDRIMVADDYDSLRFWVHGGTTGGQKVKLVLSLGGQGMAERYVDELLPGGIPAGQWAEVNVRLSELGVQGLLDGIWLWGEGEQESIYIDDMRFMPKDVGGSTSGGSTSGNGTSTGGSTSGGGTTGGSHGPSEQPITGLAFAEAPLVLRTGQLQAARVSAVRADGSAQELTEGVAWSSDDTSIATISQGLVSAMSEGETIIRAVYSGREAVLPVRVLKPAPTQPVEPVDGIYMFSDELHASITSYSWGDYALNDSSNARTGEKSIRLAPSSNSALYLYSSLPITSKEYEKLRLWVHGGASGGQQLKLVLTSGGQPVKELRLDELIPGGLQADTWSPVELQLAEHLPNGLFDGVIVAGAVDGEQPPVYLDDLALVRKYVAPPEIVEVRMNMHQLVLLPGESQSLAAESFLSNGETKVLTAEADWLSDRPDVVQVNDGTLTALRPGIALITATTSGHTAEAYVQVTEAAAEAMYTDAFEPGFHNLSWHEKDIANHEQAHSGELSIKFEPDGWDGVWLAASDKRSISDYYGFELWLHGGATGGQQLLLHAYNGYTGLGAIQVNELLPSGLPAGEWTKLTVNFAELGLSAGEFDGIIVQAATEANQSAVYIDDVSLLRNVNAGQLPMPRLPSVTITVDPNAERRPINPDIYGINFNDMHVNDSELDFPVQRWGGNNTTRYNWELDVANRASDWFFINYPYEHEQPEQLPHGSMADRFMDETHAHNGKVLLTVPTIGWTPKDRTVTYGFSQAKYGQQQDSATELRDAGNGVRPNGELITGNDPLDTSKPIGPEFVTRWMEHISERTGDQVNFYALDNEPEIWHVTHRDVHPEAPTYDEIWEFTERYGTAIKEQDADAQVFGPTSWGWCAYFYSSADNCADGPDRQAHGGKPFLEWYLEQVAAHKEETGVQLVDYLDIHFYPQEHVVTSGEEGPQAVKRRFQSLKSLYDPSFVDESWIQEPIRLIPRMKEMMQEKLPEAKLAITEYNFGNGEGISAGLAQAEALAIFGREGVDLATRFGAMKAGTFIEDAFKLYLDYDGHGSKVTGTSVSARSSNADAVGTYSIEGEDGKLFVLLFNKDSVPRTANTSTQAEGGSAASLYRFDAKSHVAAAGTLAVQEGGLLSVELPARSATLVVIEP